MLWYKHHPLPPADPVTHPLYTSEDEGAITEVATPKKKIVREVVEENRANEGLRLRPVTVVQRPLVSVAPPECLILLTEQRHNKKKGGVNNKVHIP